MADTVLSASVRLKRAPFLIDNNLLIPISPSLVILLGGSLASRVVAGNSHNQWRPRGNERPDLDPLMHPCHGVRVATTKLGEFRRRVQQETLGQSGRKRDAHYRTRRLPTMAQEPRRPGDGQRPRA